jgi:hypothetical protein
MPLELTERFLRQYSQLPTAVQKKIDKALALLDIDFRHPGLRSHPIDSIPGVFEASVDRRYRMTYERRGNTLVMRNVDNHDDCLGDP